MNRSSLIIWLVVLGQLLLLIAPSAALGQETGSSEDEYPNIVHDQNVTAIQDSYTFTANVTDNSSIEVVTFLYRYSDESKFRELEMRAAEGSDNYIIQLPESEQREGMLQYYFVATDDQGNSITHGFVFDPLLRNLLPVSADVPTVLTDAKSVPSPIEPSGNSGKRKLLYIVLGVLAVGAVASAASGGSSGGDGTDCVVEGCTINLSLPSPLN